MPPRLDTDEIILRGSQGVDLVYENLALIHRDLFRKSGLNTGKGPNQQISRKFQSLVIKLMINSKSD